MSNFLDQLNLTPQERRIVVAIGMVVIVVLNILFVWPHFGEWKRIRNELQTMRDNMEKYNRQIALDTNPANGLQKQLAKLVRQEGAGRNIRYTTTPYAADRPEGQRYPCSALPRLAWPCPDRPGPAPTMVPIEGPIR